jgi:hypothetical protein
MRVRIGWTCNEIVLHVRFSSSTSGVAKFCLCWSIACVVRCKQSVTSALPQCPVPTHASRSLRAGISCGAMPHCIEAAAIATHLSVLGQESNRAP